MKGEVGPVFWRNSLYQSSALRKMKNFRRIFFEKFFEHLKAGLTPSRFSGSALDIISVERNGLESSAWPRQNAKD